MQPSDKMVTASKSKQGSSILTNSQVQAGTYKIVNMMDGLCLDYIATSEDKSTIIVAHAHRTQSQKVCLPVVLIGSC